MMWPMNGGWGWSMAWGWIWMVLLAVLIVWAVLRLTGAGPWRDDRRAAPEPDALTLLEQRYARGELSDEQFEAMRLRLTPRAFPYDMT